MKKYSLQSLVTIDGLASSLGVSVKTVRDWVYKRKIPFTRFGRRIYFDAGVVEGILNKNAIGALGSDPPNPEPIGQGGREKGERCNG
jgi:excisionase family DNA binding protein